jgi:glycosyltransferase involved in cell wall biosynthesis
MKDFLENVKLSIITINLNNAIGIERTLHSVVAQSFKEFEYIVIDGASTDGSVEVIEKFESRFAQLKWVSEPDTGIYNAMNKGIRMASGDYIQILNSADCLASEDVTERMLMALEKADYPSILYGNMVKCFPDGRRLVDKSFAGQEITMLGMFTGTLNHDPTYIRRDLFAKYGFYDESLKIVSDWKWYLQAIILGNEKPKYVDLNVTLFDMTGISETNKKLIQVERKQVLKQLFPETVLKDYEQYAFSIEQMKRLQRYPWSYKMVWFLERCLFKLEKGKRKKTNIAQFK